ncbi:UNVERIFIED_CONTAM: hypothetical protein GTU68_013560 [Idotea baltica]|nr:hypothetical protein [Idotea baltica]
MKILILGGDGYLGWPTAAAFAARGDDVLIVDNYLRRVIAQQTNSEALLDAPMLPERVRLLRELTGLAVRFEIADLTDYAVVERLIRDEQPDTIVHYAEQPSAPYSLMSVDASRLTLNNNLNVTLNVVLAMVEHAPNSHLVKLGTMGEYGTPNIDIEEGWIDIEHKGRSDRFLFPRAAGSLYHTTKVLDTDLIWFYVRTFDLRVTDLMQGPVYGMVSDELGDHVPLLPSFHYDDIFGTAVNRFLTQAVADIPLTIYGAGGQTRGYLNLLDTLQCVKLAADNPAGERELRILNQFTETFSVRELADHVVAAGKLVGLDVAVQQIENPRRESEDHYYNPAHSGLMDLGLEPTMITAERLAEMLEIIIHYKDRIDHSRILPRVRWS